MHTVKPDFGDGPVRIFNGLRELGSTRGYTQNTPASRFGTSRAGSRSGLKHRSARSFRFRDAENRDTGF
jgi:hypothetical protein